MNYEHKEDLINELDSYLKRPDRRRVMVIFGSSRTLSFDTAYLRERHPDWALFNFSVPGGNVDYYYRYMEQFRDRRIRPDVIYFTITPQGYNAAAGISLDEVMLNGLGPLFVLRHAFAYRLEDLTNYAAKKMFWSYRYRVNWWVIQKRLAHDSKEMIRFKQFLARTYVALVDNRGSVPYFSNADPAQDPNFLKKDAENTWRTFFTPFLPAEGPFYFTEGCLKLARELEVPAILLWAPVGHDLRALEETAPIEIKERRTTVRAYWESRILPLSERYGAPLLDFNFRAPLSCDRFYDVSHLAGVCFAEFTDRIVAAAPPPQK